MPLYNPTSAGTVADGSITSAKILDGTIATADIASGAITAALISATAGGDLSGTLPSPTVAKVNGVAVTGTPAVGQALTATSTSAATWQAPVYNVPAVSDWFTTTWGSGNGGSPGSLNEMYFMPIWVPTAMTVNAISITINSATASSTPRLGIFNPDSSNRPGTLLLDAGTLDASGTGVKSATISQALSTGLYWCAVAMQGAVSTWRGFGTWIGGPLTPWGASNLVIQSPGTNFYKTTGVSGALSSSPSLTFVGNLSANFIPIIGLTRSA